MKYIIHHGRTKVFTALLLSLGAAPLLAASPATQPTKVDPALPAAVHAFTDAAGGYAELRDPAYRQRVAPAVAAAFAEVRRQYDANHARKIAAGTETAPATPADAARQQALAYLYYEAILAAVGDPATTARLHAEADSADPQIALVGRAKLAYGDVITATTLDDQQHAVDRVIRLITDADPDARKAAAAPLFGGLISISHGLPDVVADREAALFKAYAPPALAARVAEERYAGTFVGKPVALNGIDSDGKPIGTDKLKGKVVLVDFWASWCAPCKAELPRVKALYDQYHAQGFEVLGVSNDYTKAALVNYLAKSPLPWDSLFDPTMADQQKWHAVTQEFKITAIPRMFLIDRRGILRSTEARGEMETLIPQLLAENALAAND